MADDLDLIIKADNIVIDSADLSSDVFTLLDLSIKQEINDHGYAVIGGTMDADKANTLTNKLNSGIKIKISTKASEQKNKVLFWGFVEKVEKGSIPYETEEHARYSHGKEVKEMKDVIYVKITLASASKQLDYFKRNRAYLDSTKKYEDIMLMSAQKDEPATELTMKKGNEVNNEWALQYGQTAWEFIKQFASRTENVVYVNSTEAQHPVIFVGDISQGDILQPITDTDTELEHIADYAYNDDKKAIRITSYHFGTVGTFMTVKDGEFVITKMETILTMTGLRCTYELREKDSIKVRPFYNRAMGGHILTAKVLEVEKDTVKVEFVNLDKEDEKILARLIENEKKCSNDKYFQYSTTYASQNGCGLYCMPEKDDIVRIFLPTNDEKDAFASSSVITSKDKIPEDPTDKLWVCPEGKKILLTKDGISIINEDNGEKMYIVLDKKDGIKIESSLPISVTSDSDIDVKASGDLKVEASKEINIAVGKSSIQLNSTSINIGANGVFVN